MSAQQPKSPIDSAIDVVEQRAMDEAMAALDPRVAARVPLLVQPHSWDGDSEVVVDAMPDDHPTMLLWDAGQGAFRPVILPAGTRWRIVPEHPVGLWVPPGARS